MKLSLNQQIGTNISNLWKVLSDTHNRNKWISFFECDRPATLSENLSLDTTYTFLSPQKCRENYFRIIPQKEIALTVDCSKGVWTVFVILKENEEGVEMIVVAELKSNTWWPSLTAWFEAGKLELNVAEIMKKFKENVELELEKA